MSAKLLTPLGGGVTLEAANTATDKTLTLPADDGTVVYANSSGNVGIGTSSPSYKLDVSSASNVVAKFNYSGGASGYVYADANIVSYGSSTSGANSINFYDSLNLIRLYTGGTERARIDSSGTLFIAKSSISASTVGWQIESNGRGMSVFTIADTNEAFIYNNTSTAGNARIDFRTNNGTRGYINWNNSSTTYSTTSDYRLKENVQPMQNALATVQQLNPVTYTWKADGSEGQGFIAHELAEVVPDCVTGEKDEVDGDGNPKYQGIDTSFLVATLTAAIQELKEIVDAQAQRITALEGTQ